MLLDPVGLDVLRCIGRMPATTEVAMVGLAKVASL
jgi:hypothetical protein